MSSKTLRSSSKSSLGSFFPLLKSRRANADHGRRHLVRLWLRDPENAWKTPEPLKAKWAQIYDGVSPDNQIFPLEPYVRSASNSAEKKGKSSS